MTIKRIIISIIITMVLGATCLCPAMYANGSDCAFDPNLCNNTTSKSIPFDLPYSDLPMNNLRGLIIEGAELFFNSNTYYWAFVKNYEISNLFEMEPFLVIATDNMKMANAMYRILYQESLHHPYNEVVIDKLKSFDYNSFQEEFELIPSVFEKVKYYLNNGDVRGMYKKILAITSDLYADMESLQAQEFPKKSAVWRVNHKLMEAVLFGQYVAEVFNQINQ